METTGEGDRGGGGGGLVEGFREVGERRGMERWRKKEGSQETEARKV